ncbi:MAG: tRNA lysidine(34) synthetase TilS [Beijerinckiaceae bacterium]|nr:tRNA lysidine(34) synthetase TilS [Beijerinckiaceae bacterium]
MSARTLSQEPVKPRFTGAGIAAMFKPWEAARAILLGVSGGPDSVALMLLAAEWTRGRAAPPPLFVATVDHGLRKDSRDEAEMAARWAAALALPHAILSWEGVKPRARVQELAREARYTLLFEHAARIGADHVMTAHHADDQAETILFRLLRGSGISGLAGMASSSKRNGIILARPLLHLAKSELVAICQRKAHPFIRDPSNEDPSYARTRIRRLSRFLAEKGLDRNALLRLGCRAARAEAALDLYTRAVTAQLNAQRERGCFKANITALAGEPEEILLRFLADELKLIMGDKPLRLERLEALTAGLGRALRSGISYKSTLGGAALHLQSGRFLVITQEGARRRGRVTLPLSGGAGS